MTTTTLGAALAQARARNDSLVAAYKAVARRALSRAISTFAASAADQRRELGLSLAEMLEALPGGLAALELAALELEALPLGEAPDLEAAEARVLLAHFRDEEAHDRKLFADLAAAAAALDQDAAIRLGAFAEQARKRSNLIGDHLDLLSLG
jgi:hypothetical protein